MNSNLRSANFPITFIETMNNIVGRDRRAPDSILKDSVEGTWSKENWSAPRTGYVYATTTYRFLHFSEVKISPNLI